MLKTFTKTSSYYFTLVLTFRKVEGKRLLIAFLSLTQVGNLIIIKKNPLTHLDKRIFYVSCFVLKL